MTIPALYYGSPINRSHPLMRGLLARWKVLPWYKSGTRLIDLSGFRNHGILTGPTWVTGQPAGYGALNYPNTTDVIVTVPSVPSLTDLAIAPCTWAFWYKASAAGSVGAFGKNDSNTVSAGWYVEIAAGGLSLQVEGVTANVLRTSNLGSDTNVWTHGIITTDGSQTAANVHIYVNGVEGTYASSSDGSGARGSDAAFNLVIGRRYSGTNAGIFSGTIDDLCVWNRALSASEARQLYNAVSRYGDPTLSWIQPPAQLGATAAPPIVWQITA